MLGRTEKGKAKQVDDLPEWAKPDSGLAPPQMAAEAMNLLNMSFRSLKTAIREGYQHSSSPVKSTSASDPSRRQDPAGWSDAKVESLVADAEVAIRLLRDLEAGGGLQEGTAVSVEGGAQGLAFRCMQAGMASHLCVAGS